MTTRMCGCLSRTPGRGRAESRRAAAETRRILISTHAVKVVHSGGAFGGPLAHTPRLVVGIQFARLSTFTGEVGARI